MRPFPRDFRYWGLLLIGSMTGMLFASEAGASEPEAKVAEPALQVQCGLPFRDNAVLQQQIPLPVWGSTLPGAKVTVSFDQQTKIAIADQAGKWRVVLDPMVAMKLSSVNQAPDGLKMVITCEMDGGKAVKEIRNLLIGEVWLCAGQSNMAGKMGAAYRRHYPSNSVEVANYPALRQLASSQTGPWLIGTPESVPEFKKVCFFFASRLQRDILVPVGIINASVGGSNIESWLNQEPFERGGNYKSLIEPLVGFGLRGLVWYQGESNADDGREYLPKLSSLILGWRSVWGQPDSKRADGPRSDFSAYFVQLPGIGTSPTNDPAGGDGRAEIRQAQFETLIITNTGMAVTIDVGDLHEHPPNKYDTGLRLACLALHNDYGFKDVAICPLYTRHQIEGATVRISFDHAQSGLMIAIKDGVSPPKPVPDAKLDWLSIQDKDGTWHWADGLIDGSELVVSCKDVKEPVAVRYAYTIQPRGNLLYNKAGMPVGPFSTHGYGPEKVTRKKKI